jgi:site-specific recombinase XerC
MGFVNDDDGCLTSGDQIREGGSEGSDLSSGPERGLLIESQKQAAIQRSGRSELDKDAAIGVKRGEEGAHGSRFTRADITGDQADAAFFNWCIAKKLLAQSPMVNIKRPKLAKTLVPLFTREQIEALLKACANAEDECLISRNRAILLFLVDTGVRIDELISLSLDRVSLNEGSATVKGKGNKDRKVFFGAQCKKALWQYVTLHRSQDEWYCPEKTDTWIRSR